MNRTMVRGLSVLLCLYLAFGLMGCAHACNAEEQTYDIEHRELLNLPPGECVRARPDFPTRAAGWLDAVRAQQRGTPYDKDAPLPCPPKPRGGYVGACSDMCCGP
jgi:hypothetical protein